MLWMFASILASAAPVVDPAAPAEPTTTETTTTTPTPTTTTTTTKTPRPPIPVVLVLDVGGDGGSPAERRELSEALSLGFAERLQADVPSQASLRARVDLAAQQEEVGCDSASCFAELASALGAGTVVYSRLVVIGGDRVLRIEIYDDATARTVALATAKGANQGALLDRLPETLDRLIDDAGLVRRSCSPTTRASFDRRGSVPLVAGGVAVVVGVALSAGGAAALGAGNGQVDAVNAANEAWQRDPSAANLEALAAAGDGPTSTLQTSGALLIAGGVVVVGVATLVTGISAVALLTEDR